MSWHPEALHPHNAIHSLEERIQYFTMAWPGSNFWSSLQRGLKQCVTTFQKPSHITTTFQNSETIPAPAVAVPLLLSAVPEEIASPSSLEGLDCLSRPAHLPMEHISSSYLQKQFDKDVNEIWDPRPQ